MTDRAQTLALGTRVAAGAAAVVTVAAGVGLRMLAQGELAKYAGDALYTVLVYAAVVVLVPRARPLAVACAALGVSWAVEFFQLTGIPAELARESLLARLVLGSTFNAPDLLWYVAGAALATLVHSLAVRPRGWGRGGPAAGAPGR